MFGRSLFQHLVVFLAVPVRREIVRTARRDRAGARLFLLRGGSPVGARRMSASLIGHSGSSAFRLSTATASMSLTGSCFSSESAPGPFHHGVRRRGGTIFETALPSDERQVQADMRTHLIHRPARDIIPPLGGARVSSYRCDPRRFSCCCGLFPGPAEFGAVNPDAVHDHG
jgi:hypothetical protein